jgi:transcription initiation factor IIE alpha subunit
LFNKYQRKRIDDFIISTFEDFKITLLIWEKINQTESLQLPSQHIQILAFLQSKKDMTVEEVAEYPDINISKSTIRRRLNQMREEGLVDVEKRRDNYSNQEKYHYKAFQRVSKIY